MDGETPNDFIDILCSGTMSEWRFGASSTVSPGVGSLRTSRAGSAATVAPRSSVRPRSRGRKSRGGLHTTPPAGGQTKGPQGFEARSRSCSPFPFPFPCYRVYSFVVFRLIELYCCSGSHALSRRLVPSCVEVERCLEQMIPEFAGDLDAAIANAPDIVLYSAEYPAKECLAGRYWRPQQSTTRECE